MTMKREQFVEILEKVNRDPDLNENNMIDKIGKELQSNKEYLDIYKKWEEKSFDINHLFELECSVKYTIKYTLLGIAAESCYKEVVRALIKKGADVNVQDDCHMTPLDRVKGYLLTNYTDRIEVIQILEKAINQGSSQVPPAAPSSFPQGTHHKPNGTDGSHSNQQSQSRMSAGSSPAAPSPFPQGIHHQPHGKGNMLTYNNLTAEQKKLYNDLKAAIEKNGNVNDVLKSKDARDIAEVLAIIDEDGNTLLTDAIAKNVHIAKTIFNPVYLQKCYIRDITDTLTDKARNAILHNEDDTAKKIVEFSRNYQEVEACVRGGLVLQLRKYIKEGDNNAGKIFNFIKSNYSQDLLSYYLGLSDAITAIKRNNTTVLTSTLQFAQKHNILKEVFSADVYCGKNLLAFAEEQGVKERVEEIIKDVGIDMDKYKHTYSQANNNGKTTTFLDKLSEHKGKIAFGTVGTLLIIGGVIAAFVLGQPLIGGIAAVMGAAMLLTVGLAMTTEKGKEMWNEASKNLSDLFVSKQEPQQQI